MSEKSKTIQRWVSNDTYRDNYSKIFKKELNPDEPKRGPKEYNEEKLIYPEDVEVKSAIIDGKTFYYKDVNKIIHSSEDVVRFAHSNARRCGSCGEGYWGRVYTLCENCRSKKEWEKYSHLEEKEPENDIMYSDAYDRYFYGWEDVDAFFEDDDITVEDLRLLCVEPAKKRYVDLDELYADDMPTDENAEDVFSKEVMDKVDELNKLLKNHPPISYQPSKYRVKLSKEEKC